MRTDLPFSLEGITERPTAAIRVEPPAYAFGFGKPRLEPKVDRSPLATEGLAAKLPRVGYVPDPTGAINRVLMILLSRPECFRRLDLRDDFATLERTKSAMGRMLRRVIRVCV